MKSRSKNDTEIKLKNSKITSASSALDKKEIGGRGGLDPSRYGDWEKNGRCIDF